MSPTSRDQPSGNIHQLLGELKAGLAAQSERISEIQDANSAEFARASASRRDLHVRLENQAARLGKIEEICGDMQPELQRVKAWTDRAEIIAQQGQAMIRVSSWLAVRAGKLVPWLIAAGVFVFAFFEKLFSQR